MTFLCLLTFLGELCLRSIQEAVDSSHIMCSCCEHSLQVQEGLNIEEINMYVGTEKGDTFVNLQILTPRSSLLPAYINFTAVTSYMHCNFVCLHYLPCYRPSQSHHHLLPQLITLQVYPHPFIVTSCTEQLRCLLYIFHFLNVVK